MRKWMGLVALLAILGGAFVVPSETALAAHEENCAEAFESGDYNLIVGQGRIKGTNGDDLIFGSAGNDRITAGRGDDIVCGRGGADTIDGGDGADLLLGDVCDPAASSEATSCEEITGSANGVAGNDTSKGGKGNDTLWGDEGEDRLSGSRGDDMLIGGNAPGDTDETDRCDGGTGEDTLTRCP